ncbi:hypothetical protein [Paraburkholderia aromaticivorans]|uniref:Uncharacterized protein n=1 Tax=Paraburkholderia aromaticivorans TaxID=2026199 RepID=A0A248VKA9_9BURK|nr:hypothetical protein [Paraburkholderia aromaticivorans]ASV99445.1 hypothetical protein CJU94_15610 [Paraburkholderia aromaticivorans]
MKLESTVAAISFALCTLNVYADDFNGSKKLVCATVEAHACDPGLACKRSLPAELGAPRFLTLDFKKKEVTGPAHTTPMLIVDKQSDQIVMEGTEMGYAWTLILDSTDGSMTLMLANSGDAIVLFGNCTPS